ncbi:Non-reducing end beta-L-arabinofuranosidase [Fulvia fulva]|uniref:Non-reducing end beta-L-arabinofuranosidase n=1 Tax=Passalora fulva TaxID=5499 RepID=A0A9Q8LFC8_PASFU|nr:Non-reducing end beta-L-arabinofuranosidase [Fulvia fulva]KAK4626203.1 Non-reducing end beta-L-arabinofuranosidase [Fulvia fulva]UJO16417.1 Non-reducing end beta-L-arabinofuranosidase [Fulvia fulva]WPV13912.1 Non-reducing end beta-L-arabinofuranosidase [Fulvia fulva]WPV29224.1 Non-reducing end beta-L-arabinofuranosidase [Fulvia fulva]
MAYPQTAFRAVTVHDDSLIGRRRQAVVKNTLLYQLDVLKKTGRYDAFKLKWHPVYDEPPLIWPVPNHLFWDSDVAKWIEGACYCLKQQPLPEIDAAIKELVEMIRSAQQPDAYLNIHYTVVQPGKRFTNLKDMHELYNAGHLIEAALAHNNLYGNDQLLAPIVKYVELLCKTFGPHSSQTHGYPGHPEIELALLRLYERTNDPKHLELAKYFLTERGNPKGVDGTNYFLWEAQQRGDDPDKRPAFYSEPQSLWYHQAHALIADQATVEGHSVRAMYLLTAVADLCRIDKGDELQPLQSALFGLWDNMTRKKMYVTGGIGAIKQWEGFGPEYFLPQGTDEGGCYAETCAAIGIMMLAQRLLQVCGHNSSWPLNLTDVQIDCNSRYGDVMELCLYNAVLTAMSHDGKGFTYVNQLASSDTDLSKREDWFTVACCPPNMLRVLGSIGGYIWNLQQNDDARPVVTVNLYISSTLETEITGQPLRITQKTDYPWDGTVDFDVGSSVPGLELRVRSPAYASSHDISPACPGAQLQDGYLSLPADWLAEHKKFTLSIPFKARWVAPHPSTEQSTITLARGPVIYCVEDYDNNWVNDHFRGLTIDHNAALHEEKTTDATTGDSYVSLILKDGARNISAGQIPAYPSVGVEDLRSAIQQAEKIECLHFVPYYFRGNRGGKGHMRVGLKRSEQ